MGDSDFRYAYDAMTSHRLYRAALSVDMALRELEAEAGIQMDADIVEAFVTMVREQPTNVVHLPIRRAG